MFFVMWFLLFFAHWIWTNKHGASSSVKSYDVSSEFRLSLLSHLIDKDSERDEENHKVASNSETELNIMEDSSHLNSRVELASANDDNITQSRGNEKDPGLKSLCHRFRFLRALEFLLLFSYKTLTEQALQLLNCVSVGSCAKVLGEFPDMYCELVNSNTT